MRISCLICINKVWFLVLSAFPPLSSSFSDHFVPRRGQNRGKCWPSAHISLYPPFRPFPGAFPTYFDPPGAQNWGKSRIPAFTHLYPPFWTPFRSSERSKMGNIHEFPSPGTINSHFRLKEPLDRSRTPKAPKSPKNGLFSAVLETFRAPGILNRSEPP